MKLSLPTRKPKAAEATPSAGRGFQPPAFVTDTYRDMRDRRMLIPAVVLLLAILAVPFVLSSPEPPAPTPPAVETNDDALAASAAVLAEADPGIRDYRERLAALKVKDPFSEKLAGDPASEESSVGELAEPSVPVGSGAGDTGVPVDAGSDTTGGGFTSAPTTSGSTSSGGDPEPDLFFYETWIDVQVGRTGDTKLVQNIKPGDKLPSGSRPLVMFLSASAQNGHADFYVSRDITGTNGDGKCTGRGDECEFLRLEDGQTQYFRYGPNNERYALRVTDIFDKIIERREG